MSKMYSLNIPLASKDDDDAMVVEFNERLRTIGAKATPDCDDLHNPAVNIITAQTLKQIRFNDFNLLPLQIVQSCQT